MRSKTKYAMRKGYIAIDAGKLQEDCYKTFHNGKINTKVTSIGRYLEENGLCDSTFSNAFRNYERTERKDSTAIYNKVIVDNLYDTDDTSIERIGVIKSLYYTTLLNIFNLKDTYKLKPRAVSYSMSNPRNYNADNSEDLNAASAAALTAQVAELRIELRMLTKSIILLTEGIAKVNADNKPKAVVIQK